MTKLLTLEFVKLKRTFLTILLPLSFVSPIVLVLVQYCNNQNTLPLVVTKNSAFIQMISFACVVISGCYIISREYKNNLLSYLAITPKSMKQVLLCKYIILLIETTLLQLLIFVSLFIINTILSGFDMHIAIQYLTAGILSSIVLFCLTPCIVYITMVIRNFTSSAMVFLILYMLTYPFSFLKFGVFLPHLLPITLIGKFLGNERYAQISYCSGILILIVVFVLFLYLTIIKIGKKE